LIRIGLIGPPDRPEIERLALRLEERGAQPVVVDSRYDPAIRIGRGVVSACGVDLSDVRGVYVAEFRLPPPIVRRQDGEIDPEASHPALARSRRLMAAWNSLLEHLAQRIPVVNPPATHDVHALKPFEAGVYEIAGLPVPVTVSTTDPGYLATLDRRLAREWITKGMVGGFTHTESIALPETVEAARERLREAPLLFQEKIEGDNVRAFVLDGRVIGAAEVIPMAASETDSRRGDTRVRRIALPDEAARTALAAVRRWGMAFSAADFMRPGDGGRYVLLECNSAPFFVNFEARTGLDISGKLADHLVGRRPA
jgi:glutathione synthase/RimK-type ligase-like ATP-grasp enzyme